MKLKTEDGKKYSLRFTIPVVQRIRDAIGIDLLSKDGIERVSCDVVDFAAMLYHALEDQCTKEGVSADEFAVSLEGALVQASDCFLQAYADFCRKIGKPALADLAESAVACERESDAIAKEVLKNGMAKRMVRKVMDREKARRTKLVNDLLGESDESQTPG